MKSGKWKIFLFLCIIALLCGGCSARGANAAPLYEEPAFEEGKSPLPVPQPPEERDDLPGNVGQVSIVTGDVPLSQEALQAARVAGDYLSNLAYNSSMYTDYDLDSLTVLDGAVSADSLAFAAAELMDSEILSLGDEPADVDAVIERLRANMEFMKDKSAYFSQVRQANSIARKDFEVEYVIVNTDIQGKVGVIDIIENVSFQYINAAEPSFCQEEHRVLLLKADGQWLVADVETKYDWFAAQYKNTDYDIDAIIENELQNIRAMK